MRKRWRAFLAMFRLSNSAICEMSIGMDLADYHDYSDESELAGPMHGYTYHCERCGKAFMI